jgi:tetratricopeptide (TPR) repeat protein
MTIAKISRANTLLRLCRALAKMSQAQFEEATGVPAIAKLEKGLHEPTTAQLARCAKVLNRTLGEMYRLLGLYERGALAWPWDLPEGAAGLPIATREREPESVRLERAVEQFAGWSTAADALLRENRHRQRNAERGLAKEMLGALERLEGEERREVVLNDMSFQVWALAEACAERSLNEATKNVDSAMAWAELGVFVAERVEPPPLGLCVRGYCVGHVANVRRVLGTLCASERELALANELWERGEDPDRILDPGRLLELEASLRKVQRKPGLALKLLDKAEPLTQNRAHVTLQRGLALGALGKHEVAVEVLLQAGPLVEAYKEARLRNIQQFSLAANYCHLGRFEEAQSLLGDVRELALELGDEIDLIKIGWLEGRIAGGLGRYATALRALNTAAEEFERHGLHYSVALARLEEAYFLQEVGRFEEVQEIAAKLAPVFAANGVHTEALVALQLFVSAVERREVTARLTRGVLRFFFRSWGDDEVKWSEAWGRGVVPTEK